MAETNETTALPPTSEIESTAAPLPPAAGTHEVQDDVPFAAVARTHPDRVDVALEHARICARIADDNRAKDILLLDLRQATPLVDFFVIVTATSRRQSHAIAERDRPGDEAAAASTSSASRGPRKGAGS